MARRMAAFGALALALVLVSAFSAPAEARRSGHGWQGRGLHSAPRLHIYRHSHGPRLHLHRRHAIGPGSYFYHRRVHRRVFVPVPGAYGAYYYYNGPYYYDDGCYYWLRRQALRTGNPYWWDRYYACVAGYDYD